jgi:excisionase family DNA binding protein
MNETTTYTIQGTSPSGGLTVDQLRELVRTEVRAAMGQNDRREERLLTVEEAAAKLQKSKDWIYRHQKQLPFMRRIGRDLRCSEKELEKWIASRRITC